MTPRSLCLSCFLLWLLFWTEQNERLSLLLLLLLLLHIIYYYVLSVCCVFFCDYHLSWGEWATIIIITYYIYYYVLCVCRVFFCDCYFEQSRLNEQRRFDREPPMVLLVAVGDAPRFLLLWLDICLFHRCVLIVVFSSGSNVLKHWLPRIGFLFFNLIGLTLVTPHKENLDWISLTCIPVRLYVFSQNNWALPTTSLVSCASNTSVKSLTNWSRKKVALCCSR